MVAAAASWAGGQVPLVSQEPGTWTADTGSRDRNDAAAPDAVTFTKYVPEPNRRRLRELIAELEELSLAVAEGDLRWNS